jgi:hypothetical protein
MTAATGFQRALEDAGLPGAVEGFDRLAVIRCDASVSPEAIATKPARQRVIALAREHGFTHVAVELEPTPGAAVPGGQS